MTFNEYELIYLIRGQSEEAQSLLMKRYSPFIGKLASKYRVKGTEYEDFFQEGLVAFTKAIYSYNEFSTVSFYTYCMTCVKNAMISYYKKSYRTTMLEYDFDTNFFDGYEINEQVVCHYRNSFDNRLHEKIVLQTHLQQGSNLLSDLEKQCLKYLLNGHNYKEIATLLSISSKKVENAVTRSKIKLKKENVSR